MRKSNEKGESEEGCNAEVKEGKKRVGGEESPLKKKEDGGSLERRKRVKKKERRGDSFALENEDRRGEIKSTKYWNIKRLESLKGGDSGTWREKRWKEWRRTGQKR